MKVTIAESTIAATDLMNALQSINRERERISENETAVRRFESCKQLRRKVLRYVSCYLSPSPILLTLPLSDLSRRIRTMARWPPPRERRAGPGPHDL
jgi:hypothetical protein